MLNLPPPNPLAPTQPSLSCPQTKLVPCGQTKEDDCKGSNPTSLQHSLTNTHTETHTRTHSMGIWLGNMCVCVWTQVCVCSQAFSSVFAPQGSVSSERSQLKTRRRSSSRTWTAGLLLNEVALISRRGALEGLKQH